MPAKTSKQPDKPKTAAATDAAVAAGMTPDLERSALSRPVGGVALAGGLPAGALSRALAGEADVSDELAAAAPSFGAVLRSIGDAIVNSQMKLDAGVVDTVKTLDDAKITVVTDVIQKLDDDGLPMADETELITQELSALNFVTPTVHEWKHVAVSMDLEVGAMDRETGFTFSRTQKDTNLGFHGLFWGFVGWSSMETDETRDVRVSSTDRETEWSRGQVRVDAMLAPRRTTKFPVPAEVSVGPRLYFAQGASTDADADGVITRSLALTLTVRKADGTANPGKVVSVDAGTLRVAFADTDGFTGSTTNAAGQVRVTLTRTIPSVFFQAASRRSVTATLGQLSQTTSVVI